MIVGKDCKTEEFLYVFKNIRRSNGSFEKIQNNSQFLLNGSFRIETADLFNKDGTNDLYGFKEDWFNSLD